MMHRRMLLPQTYGLEHALRPMRNNQPVTQHEFDFPADATLMSTTDVQSHIQYCNAAFIAVSAGAGGL